MINKTDNNDEVNVDSSCPLINTNIVLNEKTFFNLIDYTSTNDHFNLTETFDKTALKTILDNFDELRPKLGNLKDIGTNGSFAVITNEKQFKTILQNLYKRKDDIEYSYAKSKTQGRRFAKNSLQNINKIIRHTLLKEMNMEDWDIVNAHYKFTEFVCECFGIEHSFVTEYNDNREGRYQEIMDVFNMSREDTKDVFLSALNGGGCVNILQVNGIPPPLWFSRFFNELKHIREDLSKLDCFSNELSHAKRKKTINTLGTFINTILCKVEDKVLICATDFLLLHGVTPNTYCFDGLIVREPSDFDISSIDKYLLQTFGINLEFVVKPMDKAIDITGYTVKTDDSSFNHDCFTDEKCGIYITNYLVEHELVFFNSYENIFYFYNEDTKLFEKHDKIKLMTYISRILRLMFEELGLVGYNTFTFGDTIRKMISRRVTETETTSSQRSILSQIVIRLPHNDKFIQENFNRNKFLYPIADNKVIDFLNDTVRDRRKTDYFTFTTELTYNPDIDIDTGKRFIQEFLIPTGKSLSPDDILHIDCFLQTLGYCITGFNTEKIILCLIGVKDTGKSTFGNKFFDMLGDFQAVLNKKVVCKSSNEAVHNAELFCTIGKRIGTMAELDENEKPNASFLKSISGNDKYISIRAPAKDEIKAIIDIKFIISSNDMFNTTDQALLGRLRVFDFPNVFTGMTPQKRIDLDNLDFASVVFKYAHYYCKHQKIVLSKQVLLSTQNQINICNPVHSFFHDKYENTGVKSDRMPKKEIYEFFKINNRGTDITSKKFHDSVRQCIDIKELYDARQYMGVKKTE